jgi:hypothetical protein
METCSSAADRSRSHAHTQVRVRDPRVEKGCGTALATATFSILLCVETARRTCAGKYSGRLLNRYRRARLVLATLAQTPTTPGPHLSLSNPRPPAITSVAVLPGLRPSPTRQPWSVPVSAQGPAVRVADRHHSPRRRMFDHDAKCVSAGQVRCICAVERARPTLGVRCRPKNASPVLEI